MGKRAGGRSHLAAETTMVPSSEEGERELALVARLTELVVHPVLREGGRAGGGEGGREDGREGGMTGMTTDDATGSNGPMTIEHHGCSDLPPSLPPFLPPSLPSSLPPSLPPSLPAAPVSLLEELGK